MVSFATVGEQYAGYLKQIMRGTWNASHLARLEEQLQIFATVPHDVEVCRTYGTICAALMRKQRTAAPNDLWIAASAIRYSLPLVTNNRRHFAAISGLRIISEAP